MRAWRLVYWLITGGVIGLGLAEFSLGPILVPIGLVLLIIGLIAVRSREVVAAVVGLGAFPTLLFAYVIVSIPPPPNTAVSSYIYGGAIISGVITVVGVVALMLVWRARVAG